MKTRKILFLSTIAILGVISKSNAQTSWNLTGNSGTTANNSPFLVPSLNAPTTPFTPTKFTFATENYIGTSDNTDLYFGRNNTFAGYIGLRNTIFGTRELTGTNEPTGTINTRNSIFGAMAGRLNYGNFNTFIGYISGMKNTTGSGNTFVGSHTGQDVSTGGNNLLLGNYSGAGLYTGSCNVFIGNVTSPSQTTNNNIILADGSGTQRINILSNGNMGISTATPAERLEVNGNAKAVAFISTSDKKFKKNIKSLENSLETIEAINGKSYQWNGAEFKDKNFDSRNHSGFIAQELEKVLPHLVYTSENGDKAVNYIELMPYLVEAIKEQQKQINDLKSQISDNFKAQNQDLIELSNTKIINVSPNPSSDVITISFNLEKSVEAAVLQVHDLNGTLLSSLSIKDRDNNLTRTLQKDNFGKGIYIVSLVVNGKSIDTKKIAFN